MMLLRRRFSLLRVSSMILSVAMVASLAPSVFAQDGPRGPRGDGARGGGEGGGANDEKSSIKPYDEVITDKAVTSKGLFRVHLQEDKVLFEIPPSGFGSDMVWVATIAETTEGSSYGGMPIDETVVRWEQRGENVLLRQVRYGIRADTDDPIALAVRVSNLAPIIKKFAVKAYGTDKAPVIDVTELFTKNVPEVSAQRALGAGGIDSGRSFVEQVKAFPLNVETKVLATFAPGSGGGGRFGGGPPPGPGGGGAPRTSGITALIHHSMVKLPDNPMTPRRHDSRVGFFSVGFTDYALDEHHEVESVRYITRWRLEKKNPEAEVSDPVKPIVFYVGRGTPEKWKSYVKAGIEDWLPAFEAAGFSNAIVGKYPPDPSEDPDWDAEDARISSIRWLASGVENAFGPHVSDPRTGEILEADVRMFHNVQKLARDWYFVQTAAVDERAQKLPLPDELVGELIRFVVAHEVGHSLGFPHNMKASSSYTIEQLRDPEWTKNNGTAPSIMDYARFNYVAQPGDGASLLPGVGPYDLFATEWGYRQFADDEQEESGLAALVAKQIDEPMFRFGGGGDPSAQSEDLSNNAVEATRLGLANLNRIADFVIEATSNEGEDYDRLSNMYNQLVSQFNREMGHVANAVGGVEQINLYYGDADQRFFPLDGDYQRSAVAFLLENAFQTPDLIVNPDINLRLSADGAASRVLSSQGRLVSTLVNARRVNRMAEHAERIGASAYTPAQMLADLRSGIFSELDARSVGVDIYRRNLQRTYVDHLASLIATPAANSDLPALARAELVSIGETVGAKAGAGANTVTSAHLADLAARIEHALDNEND